MKHAATWLLGLSILAAGPASLARDDPYPVDQWRAWLGESADRYPGKTWLMYAAPEEAGWSSAGLRRAKRHFDAIDSAAVMVVHDGAVVVAWGDVDRRYMCHSVRKSLLSALYGIHVAQGTIDLDKTLAELGIDDDPPLSEAEKQARVVDLLRSRSGVYHPAAYETLQMKILRPRRGSRKPGEFFYYNNWDFNTLGTIFEQETGKRIFEEFQKQFAATLDMEDYRTTDGYYHLTKKYSIHPAYPFRMSARDLARVGLLYLRQGKWQGRQILTRQWVRDSITSHFKPGDVSQNPDYGYGYLWWPIVKGPFHRLGMFSARGHGGHSIDVLPQANVVFVHRVNTFGDSKLGFEMDEVEDPDRFKLLDLVLRARVAPPKPDPKLVPLPASPKRAKTVVLDRDTLAKYVGRYEFVRFTLKKFRFEKLIFKIKKTGGELMVECPDMGRFLLRPMSKTRFMIEDLELPIRFELDDKGKPVRIIGEFVPGRPLAGRRVR